MVLLPCADRRVLLSLAAMKTDRMARVQCLSDAAAPGSQARPAAVPERSANLLENNINIKSRGNAPIVH